MADETQAGGGSGADRDPWAPPEHRTSLDKQPQQPGTPTGQPPQPHEQRPPQPGAWDQPSAPQPMGQPPSVHDQATMMSMPAGGFTAPGFGPPGGAPGAGGPEAAPPPPMAPSGPGTAPGGYGYPGYPATGYGWSGMPMAPQNGMGVAAMVLGIIACCLFCLYGVVSVVTGILAVVFGIKGRKRVEAGVATNHGQAQAGLIMGIIGIVLGIAVIVLIAVGITAAINSDEADDPYYGAQGPVATAPAHR